MEEKKEETKGNILGYGLPNFKCQKGPQAREKTVLGRQNYSHSQINKTQKLQV